MGTLDELKDVENISAQDCPVRIIITVQKLREVGWIRFQPELRWMNRPEDRKQVFTRRIGENDLPIPGIAEVRTGTDGSFAFAGIGKSRLAILSVTHPEIATASIAVLTESGNTLQIPTFKDDKRNHR